MRSTFILLVLLTLALTACAQALSEPELQATMQVAITLTSLVQTPIAPATTEAPPVATIEPTTEPPAPVATESTGPEVVFLAEGAFSDEEKTQIINRVVEPFIHYYDDLADNPSLLTITIEKYDGLAGYPYSANAIFEGGGYTGWLVPATGGLVDWWIPECMGPCPLSDEFRAAYPEIVAILEP